MKYFEKVGETEGRVCEFLLTRLEVPAENFVHESQLLNRARRLMIEYGYDTLEIKNKLSLSSLDGDRRIAHGDTKLYSFVWNGQAPADPIFSFLHPQNGTPLEVTADMFASVKALVEMIPDAAKKQCIKDAIESTAAHATSANQKIQPTISHSDRIAFLAWGIRPAILGYKFTKKLPSQHKRSSNQKRKSSPKHNRTPGKASKNEAGANAPAAAAAASASVETFEQVFANFVQEARIKIPEKEDELSEVKLSELKYSASKLAFFKNFTDEVTLSKLYKDDNISTLIDNFIDKVQKAIEADAAAALVGCRYGGKGKKDPGASGSKSKALATHGGKSKNSASADAQAAASAAVATESSTQQIWKYVKAALNAAKDEIAKSYGPEDANRFMQELIKEDMSKADVVEYAMIWIGLGTLTRHATDDLTAKFARWKDATAQAEDTIAAEILQAPALSSDPVVAQAPARAPRKTSTPLREQIRKMFTTVSQDVDVKTLDQLRGISDPATLAAVAFLEADVLYMAYMPHPDTRLAPGKAVRKYVEAGESLCTLAGYNPTNGMFRVQLARDIYGTNDTAFDIDISVARASARDALWDAFVSTTAPAAETHYAYLAAKNRKDDEAKSREAARTRAFEAYNSAYFAWAGAAIRCPLLQPAVLVDGILKPARPLPQSLADARSVFSCDDNAEEPVSDTALNNSDMQALDDFRNAVQSHMNGVESAIRQEFRADTVPTIRAMQEFIKENFAKRMLSGYIPHDDWYFVHAIKGRTVTVPTHKVDRVPAEELSGESPNGLPAVMREVLLTHTLPELKAAAQSNSRASSRETQLGPRATTFWPVLYAQLCKLEEAPHGNVVHKLAATKLIAEIDDTLTKIRQDNLAKISIRFEDEEAEVGWSYYPREDDEEKEQAEEDEQLLDELDDEADPENDPEMMYGSDSDSDSDSGSDSDSDSEHGDAKRARGDSDSDPDLSDVGEEDGIEDEHGGHLGVPALIRWGAPGDADEEEEGEPEADQAFRSHWAALASGENVRAADLRDTAVWMNNVMQAWYPKGPTVIERDAEDEKVFPTALLTQALAFSTAAALTEQTFADLANLEAQQFRIATEIQKLENGGKLTSAEVRKIKLLFPGTGAVSLIEAVGNVQHELSASVQGRSGPGGKLDATRTTRVRARQVGSRANPQRENANDAAVRADLVRERDNADRSRPGQKPSIPPVLPMAEAPEVPGWETMYPFQAEGKPLRAWQQANLEMFKRQKEKGQGFLVADDMGMGKTVSGIALACSCLQVDAPASTRQRILIVCPGNTIYEPWKLKIMEHTTFKSVFCFTNEQTQHIPGRKEAIFEAELKTGTHVAYVISHTYLGAIYKSRNDPTGRSNKLWGALTQGEWNCVVVDEAHIGGFQNAKTLVHGAVAELTKPKKVPIVMLTGTPYENDYTELANLCSLLRLDDQICTSKFWAEHQYTNFPEPETVKVREGGEMVLFAGSKPRVPFMTRTTKSVLSGQELKPLYVFKESYNASLAQVQRIYDILYDAYQNPDAVDPADEGGDDMEEIVEEGEEAPSVKKFNNKVISILPKLDLATCDVYLSADVRTASEIFKPLVEDTSCTWATEESLQTALQSKETFHEFKVKAFEHSLMKSYHANTRKGELPGPGFEAQHPKWATLLRIATDMLNDDYQNGATDAWSNAVAPVPVRKAPRKVIIFSRYRMLLRPLAELFSDQFGMKPPVVDGVVPAEERANIIEAWTNPNNKQPFLLASTDTCSTGIDLRCACGVIFITNSWNAATEQQAIARAWRLFQPRDVRVAFIVPQYTTVAGEVLQTPESLKVDVIERKRDEASYFYNRLFNSQAIPEKEEPLKSSKLLNILIDYAISRVRETQPAVVRELNALRRKLDEKKFNRKRKRGGS